jgi:hypothetical protein
MVAYEQKMCIGRSQNTYVVLKEAIMLLQHAIIYELYVFLCMMCRQIMNLTDTNFAVMIETLLMYQVSWAKMF